MNANLAADRAMQAQLDRLVAGELAENDRRNVLAWLDEDTRRWRACAVAFLEAQMWEAATARAPESLADVSKSAAQHRAPRGGNWLRTLSLAAAAALLLVAGHLSARFWPAARSPQLEVAQPTPATARGPLVASVSVRTNLSPGLAAQLQIPVSPVPADAPPASALSDYERKQWERRGFDVQEELRYLPAKLPDGTPVLVPVNKVQVKLKRTPVS